MLAELMRALARGERRWTEVTRLSEGAVSLPSGVLHRVPIGAPVTLHTLAALLVALSDNIAADQLLRVLGRDRIEAVMEVTGHARPASNTPFLSTRELFVFEGRAHRESGAGVWQVADAGAAQDRSCNSESGPCERDGTATNSS